MYKNLVKFFLYDSSVGRLSVLKEQPYVIWQTAYIQFKVFECSGWFWSEGCNSSSRNAECMSIGKVIFRGVMQPLSRLESEKKNE